MRTIHAAVSLTVVVGIALAIAACSSPSRQATRRAMSAPAPAGRAAAAAAEPAADAARPELASRTSTTAGGIRRGSGWGDVLRAGGGEVRSISRVARAPVVAPALGRGPSAAPGVAAGDDAGAVESSATVDAVEGAEPVEAIAEPELVAEPETVEPTEPPLDPAAGEEGDAGGAVVIIETGEASEEVEVVDIELGAAPGDEPVEAGAEDGEGEPMDDADAPSARPAGVGGALIDILKRSVGLGGGGAGAGEAEAPAGDETIEEPETELETEPEGDADAPAPVDGEESSTAGSPARSESVASALEELRIVDGQRRHEARTIFDAARTAFERGKYDEARALALRAAETHPSLRGDAEQLLLAIAGKEQDER